MRHRLDGFGLLVHEELQSTGAAPGTECEVVSPEKMGDAASSESKFGNRIINAHNLPVMKVILTSLLAAFTVSGALAQQLTVTIPGGHDREWYEHHGYFWHDGQWYRGEDRERHEYREHHQHNGYWKDGHYYRYENEDHG
jgi:hypothetical protein